jgi:prolyl-tRNA synthetase
MKDLYSFHANEEDLEEFYKIAEKAYEKIWARLGIGEITVKTYASGGAFSKYSHEYQTFSEVGEDTIYYCPKCNIALNSEIIEDQKNACPECGNSELEEKKAIEVGNIFKLKTKFSEAFKFKFTDKDGQQKPVIMGCYGIGPSRLMGTLVEINNDANGIMWPKEIAPFQIHIVLLKDKDDEVNENIKKEAEKLYQDLTAAGFEVLLDDRENSSNGEKLKDSDLIGIPMRLLLSSKTLQADSIELKLRTAENSELLEINSELLENLKEKLENYGI